MTLDTFLVSSLALSTGLFFWRPHRAARGLSDAHSPGDLVGAVSGTLKGAYREARRNLADAEEFLRAQRVEKAIGRCMRRLKIRATLMLAEAKADAAREAVMSQRFAEAEELMETSADLLRRASVALAQEPRYHLIAEGIRRVLREVMGALRGHAEITIRRMDHLLAENLQSTELREAEDVGVTPMRASQLASLDAAA